MANPVKRRHRAAYDIDYQPRLVSLGPVTVWVEEDNVTQKIGMVTDRLADNAEVMRVISDRMVEIVRENILTGELTPLRPETIERRKYPFLPSGGIGARMAVGGSRPLVASGSLVRDIEARSKAGYAAAQRGKDQWYGFLHNEGVGRLDRRPFMYMSAPQADEITRIYDDWMTAVVEED